MREVVARFEWQQDPSSAADSAFQNAAETLISTFGLTDEELAFDRAWEIKAVIARAMRNAGDFRLTVPDEPETDEDDDFLDVLVARCEANYLELCRFLAETPKVEVFDKMLAE